MQAEHGSRTHTATRSTAERSERYLRATAVTVATDAMDAEAIVAETVTLRFVVREVNIEYCTS